ncbi:tRNA lysidine(34) synthetase TilS [Candidatus Clavichlamydia salmonicola]|uniref:tRNA lysidine(34) synthetase TilS n=1 Tax=Candidatus Clavichlamydia salmonicola TaxID=469812 RepID=UPI001891E95F|nr:tRNA lysidine(34) synthetase TilS [Candidatus Clavichlamydia salmonicola]
MLEKTFLDFFHQFSSKTSFLLGYSGGPDSTALFYLLLKYKLSFEVAHIDHGWRLEDKQEALLLKNLCKEKNIPFHLHEISQDSYVKGNQENIAREIRLKFFKKIIDQQKLGALLLGHHADDCAEVILQRVFGGAEIYNFKSIQPAVIREDCLFILRPFLTIRKAEILKWLDQNKISFFQDLENFGTKLLRGRMRTTLIPFLEKEYGKNMTSSLAKVAQSSNELHAFLEEMVDTYDDKVMITDEGTLLTIEPQLLIHSFLLKFIIKKFLRPWNLVPSGGLLDALVMHLQKGSKAKRLRIRNHILIINHYTLKLSLTLEKAH